jgi:hypothetical protein
MTKRRGPLTFELALTRVAGEIGWSRVAEIAQQSDRTVRNWSEPDTGPAAERAISLDVALRLDSAFQAAGADGAPFLQCYALRLEADIKAACADSRELGLMTGRLAHESGEAIQAAITAALPGASENEKARAELELEQASRALTDTLATLRAGRRGEVQTAGPEVAAPACPSPGRGNE